MNARTRKGRQAQLSAALLVITACVLPAKDLSDTKYRPLPATRSIADLSTSDFTDNMESGFVGNLEKTGPGSFVFDVQQPSVYGDQGTIRVWFFGACDTRRVEVKPSDALHMGLRWPVGNSKMRPVYSYDSVNWSFVPDGWGRRSKDDNLFRFDVPLRPGADRVYFAAHYPYPAARVLERAIELAKNSLVRSIEILGRSERERPITLMTITDPSTPDRQKKRVLLTAGDHGGETASAWGLEGSIDFLLSDDATAQALRRKNVFYIIPLLNVDGYALGTDRRQATGVNIYFDYRNFESREARVAWNLVKEIKPALWLDYHSWHLGMAEGMYGPHPKFVGEEQYARITPLIDSINKHFPIVHQGPDTLDSPTTQALLRLGVPGLCPEFNFGRGADGAWKTVADQKALGAKIMLGIAEYLANRN